MDLQFNTVPTANVLNIYHVIISIFSLCIVINIPLTEKKTRVLLLLFPMQLKCIFIIHQKSNFKFAFENKNHYNRSTRSMVDSQSELINHFLSLNELYLKKLQAKF